MKLSLHARITLVPLLSGLALSLSLTLLGGGLFYGTYTSFMEQRSQVAAHGLADQANQLLALGLELRQITGFDPICQQIVKRHQDVGYAWVVDRAGLPVFVSDTLPGELSGGIPAGGKEPMAYRSSSGDYLLASYPVVNADGVVRGAALVAVKHSVLVNATLHIVAWFLAAGLAIMLVGLLAQHFVLRRTITQPVSRMLGFIEALDLQNLPREAPARLRANHELGRLAEAFSRLLERLSQSRDALLASRAELEQRVDERTRDLREANRSLAADIAQRALLEEELKRLANTDSLTGLCNRAFLAGFVANRLQHASRHGEMKGLLLFDFDGFKAVNDTHGHAAGDHVLTVCSARARQVCRKSDIVARLGGDEFAIFAEDFDHPEHLARLAEKLSAAIAEPIPYGEGSLRLGVSIGIAIYPEHGRDLSHLMRAADRAMYEAKAAGGGHRYCCARPELV